MPLLSAPPARALSRAMSDARRRRAARGAAIERPRAGDRGDRLSPRPAARRAGADGRRGLILALALRASRRRRILPAGHRRPGDRDRAGAGARMAGAAAGAVGARRLPVRRPVPRASPISRSRRSSSRRPNGCGCCPSGSASIRETLGPLFDVYADLERFIDDLVRQFGRGPGVAHPDGDGRDAQFAAPDHRHLGAVRGRSRCSSRCW